jgi:hypothetical protein
MALRRASVRRQKDLNSFTDSQEAAVNHRGMVLGYRAVTCLADVALWLRQGWTKNLRSGARVQCHSPHIQCDLAEKVTVHCFDWPLQRSGCRFLAQLALFSSSIAKTVG